MDLLSTRQLLLLVKTFNFALLTTLGAFFLGVVCSLAIEKSRGLPRRLIYLLFLFPLLMPAYLHALAWRYLLLDFSVSLVRWLYHPVSAALILALAWFPLFFFATVAKLKNIPPSLEEAGLLIFGRWQVLRKIVLPQLTDTLLAVFLFVFILSLINFDVPSLLHVSTYPLEIFTQFSAFFNVMQAFRLNVPLLLLVWLWIVLANVILKERPLFSSLNLSQETLTLFDPPLMPRIILGLLILGLLSASAFVPMGSLLRQIQSWDVVRQTLGLTVSVTAKSFLLAALSAGMVVVGLLCLFASQSQASLLRRLRWLRGLSLMTLAVPSISLGVLLIYVFNHPATEIIYQSPLILIIGYVLRGFPFAFEVLYAQFLQINPALIEAGYLANLSRSSILFYLLLPLLAPAFLIAFLIVLILSLTDLGLSLLVHPSGWQTLSVRIYTLLHYGAVEMVAVLGLFLVVSIVCATILIWLLSRSTSFLKGSALA